MSGITVVSANPSVEKTFLEFYGRSTAVRRVWSEQWKDPIEVAMDACAASPELVVFGGDVEPDDIRSVIPEIDQRFPSVTILCLALAKDVEYSMTVLRLGAREVLVEQAATDEFRAQVDPVFDIARARHRRGAESGPGLRRRVITVVSPKGGTGKTTLATNLAVGLARRLPKQVVLVDLDVQFGDCAAALGLQPEYSLVDAIEAESYQRSALKVFPAFHESGLAVLSPPEDLSVADDIDPDGLKRVISAFAEEFPFTVIDTAGGIDSVTLAAMEQATDLLFVSTTDVPSIRAVRRQIDALDQIGFVSQRRTFVLNRANAKVGLSVAEIEATIGLEATFQIPSTRLIPLSTNEARPAIDKGSGGLAARRLEELALYFAPDQDHQSRRFLRSLRKER